MPDPFRKRIQQSVAAGTARLLEPKALAATLDRLVVEGVISEEDAGNLHANLCEQVEGSRYVLTHLGAHFAIGAIFAFDLVPLPLGTIGRVSWVGGSRLVEWARGNADRARVHSLPVLLLAAVPWLGYAAYLLPLRRQSAELTFLLANHIWLSRKGRTYEQFVNTTRLPIRRLARWLVPLPG